MSLGLTSQLRSVSRSPLGLGGLAMAVEVPLFVSFFLVPQRLHPLAGNNSAGKTTFSPITKQTHSRIQNDFNSRIIQI